ASRRRGRGDLAVPGLVSAIIWRGLPTWGWAKTRPPKTSSLPRSPPVLISSERRPLWTDCADVWLHHRLPSAALNYSRRAGWPSPTPRKRLWGRAASSSGSNREPSRAAAMDHPSRRSGYFSGSAFRATRNCRADFRILSAICIFSGQDNACRVFCQRAWRSSSWWISLIGEPCLVHGSRLDGSGRAVKRAFVTPEPPPGSEQRRIWTRTPKCPAAWLFTSGRARTHASTVQKRPGRSPTFNWARYAFRRSDCAWAPPERSPV